MLSSSNGMSWFSWSSSGRDETLLHEKANLVQTKQQKPEVAQLAPINKMKRKRGESSPVSPRLGAPVPKIPSETMSHVQIPAVDGLRAYLPTLGKQTDRHGASTQPDMLGNLDMKGAVEEGTQQSEPPLDQSALHGSAAGILEGPESGTRHHLTRVGNSAALRDAIVAQFGLEILLKHKELRLIDQEFAKCQVALEQLRRCHVIPYSALSSSCGDMQAASCGTGPAFNDRAPYAPPWGVTNGPYSRHYERWLIPDSAFDENFVETLQTPMIGGKALPDRATRGSQSVKGMFGTKSRSQRGSASARLKALPHGYPEPKEEKGPMIVKRSSDGKMVKLVCLDCRRSNFNSAQGFINHCRIAHSRQFLSHDAAIEASGEEIDADTEAGLGEMTSQATASVGLVHPLIRSAHIARTSPTDAATPVPTTSRRKKSQPAAISTLQPSTPPGNAPTMSTPSTTTLAPPSITETDPVRFNPSPRAPHLSALFARTGRGGDLDELVTEATTRPEIDLTLLSEDEDGDEEIDDATEQLDEPQSRSTRGVLRGGDLPAQTNISPSPSEQTPTQPPCASAALQRPAYLPNMADHAAYPSPYNSEEGHPNHHSALLDQQSPFNLSPNTVESHTAPSLVSDDGEYENTHSESESPSSAEPDDDDDHYIHTEMMDHDEMDLGEGSSSQDHHLGLGAKPHGPPTRRQSSAMRPPTAIHHGAPEQRHVSFASPLRRLRRGSKAKVGH